METIIVANKVIKIYLDEAFVKKNIKNKAIKIITELLELYPNITINEFGEVECYNHYYGEVVYKKRYNTAGAFNPKHERILFIKESINSMPLEVVILHEFGHAIDYFLIKDKLVSSLPVIKEKFNEYSRNNESKFPKEISSYALENEQEFFAEWFYSFYLRKEHDLGKYNRPIIEYLNNIQDKLLSDEQKKHIETTNRFKEIERIKYILYELNKKIRTSISYEVYIEISDKIEKCEAQIRDVINSIINE